jgi:hypothetical protein
MISFPYKEIDWDNPQTTQDLIEAMDRPILHLWGAEIYVTSLCPPGCIRVEDDEEIVIECARSSIG